MFNWPPGHPHKPWEWSKIWVCHAKRLLEGYFNLKKWEDSLPNLFIRECLGTSLTASIWMLNSTALNMFGTSWEKNFPGLFMKKLEECTSIKIKKEWSLIFLKSSDILQKQLLRSWRGTKQSSKELSCNSVPHFLLWKIPKVKSTNWWEKRRNMPWRININLKYSSEVYPMKWNKIPSNNTSRKTGSICFWLGYSRMKKDSQKE